MSEVCVVVDICQCHVGTEYDLCGLFSVLRRSIACASLAVSCGCLDEVPFVCYGVHYSVECEYWQLWIV